MVAPVRSRILGVFAGVLALAACSSDAKPSADPSTSAPRTSESRSSQSSAPPTRAAATAPPAGTQLTAFTGDGRVNLLAGDGGFTILQSSVTSLGPDGVDQSTISTYDVAGSPLARVPSGGFTGECGAEDVSPGGHRLVIAAKLAQKPAQGVIAAQYSKTLVAYDAETGKQAWTADLVPFQSEPLSCSAFDGHLEGFQATHDGAWASLRVQSGNLSMATAVDLATGKLEPKADVIGALGNSLVTGTQRNDFSHPDIYVLTTPPAWRGVASFSTGSALDLIPLTDPSDATYGLFGGSGGGYGATTGLSSDAGLLFIARQNEAYGTLLQAFSLPTMAEAWRQSTAEDLKYGLIGSGGDILVVTRQAAGGVTTEGLNARTGATLWTLPKVDSVCGLSTTQMLVSANGQLAVIDLASGEQLSYTAPSSSSSTSCPVILRGGIAAGSGTSAGMVVTQVLAP